MHDPTEIIDDLPEQTSHVGATADTDVVDEAPATEARAAGEGRTAGEERTAADADTAAERSLRLLFVEDSPDDVELFLRPLRRAGYSCDWQRVDSEAALRDALCTNGWHVAFVDYVLPGFSGHRALSLIGEAAPDLPSIVASGHAPEDVVAETARLGAVDYILKHDLTRVVPAVEHAVRDRRARLARRSADRRLRDREQTLSTLLSNLPGMVYRCGTDPAHEDIEFLSEGVRHLTGHDPGEFLSGQLSWRDLVHPDDRAACEEIVGRALESRRPYTLTYRIVTAAGDERSVWERGRAVFDAAGAAVALEGFVHDVTAERRAEDAERAARQDVELALVGGELGMYHSHYPEDRCVVDDRYLGMLGYDRGDVDVRPSRWLELVHPEDRAPVAAAYAPVLRGESDSFELEYRMRCRDGGYCWILDRGRVGLRAADGSILRTDGTHLDITARKEAESRLAKTAGHLRRLVAGVADAMGTLVEMRDPYTAGHERRVAHLAVLVAEELGWPCADVQTLGLAAKVHDVGKIAVPAEILARPGRLQPTEWAIIQTHPQVGHDILAAVDFDAPVAEMVLQHHERLDGSGYPAGLKGDQILPAARVLAVADVVEAMASHRPYRPALGLDMALREIREKAGTLFEAPVVDACAAVVQRPDFSFDGPTEAAVE